MKAEILHKNGGTWIVDLNRREALKDHCYDCSGFDWSEVKNCLHKKCPSYPFRTGKGKQDPKDRATAIKLTCMFCMDYQIGEISLCTSPNCPLYEYKGYILGIITPEFLKIDRGGYFPDMNFRELYPNTKLDDEP